jgi:hypothetical protein
MSIRKEAAPKGKQGGSDQEDEPGKKYINNTTAKLLCTDHREVLNIWNILVTLGNGT